MAFLTAWWYLIRQRRSESQIDVLIFVLGSLAPANGWLITSIVYRYKWFVLGNGICRLVLFVDCLTEVLNTNVDDSSGIVNYLASALGRNGAGEEQTSPIASDSRRRQYFWRRGKSKFYVEQTVCFWPHAKSCIYIIVTQNKDGANCFVMLDAGKIRVFPGFYEAEWTPWTAPSWISFRWTIYPGYLKDYVVVLAAFLQMRRLLASR